MMTRLSRSAVGVVVLVMLMAAAAGCGGGDDTASDDAGEATTFPPPATDAIPTTTAVPTPEQAAAVALCEAMHTIGVTQFIGEDAYDFPESFEVRAGQRSVIQCAINSGFRSISVAVIDFTDVAGAMKEFENSTVGNGGEWEPIAGLADRAAIDVPDPSAEDKSAAVRLILGTRYVSVSNIAGLDDPPDRAVLQKFATAIAAVV